MDNETMCCHTLFLKLQSDDDLRMSLGKPTTNNAYNRVTIHDSVANKVLKMCGWIKWYSQVTILSKLNLMPNISVIEKVVQQSAGICH